MKSDTSIQYYNKHGINVTPQDIKKRNIDEAMSLSIDKRQEYLDHIRNGLTIGEAIEKSGVSFNQAMGIMSININKHKFYTLNKKSK